MNIIEETKTLVINYFETENIMVRNNEINEVVNKWYSFFPNLDFITLAALAIDNPKEIPLTKSEIRKIRDFYFPYDLF